MGLEDEVRWHYYTKGTLSRVISNAELLISRSTASNGVQEEDSDRAVPRLTQGGILPLRRTLVKLHALLDAHAAKSS